MAKRGRRKRVDAAEATDAARDDGQQRSIYQQGGSWVVAVPHWVRRTLDRAGGGAVYWHDAGAGAILLSDSPTRRTGSAVLTTMQRELNRLRRENDRLHRKARARPLKVLNEGVSQGVGIGMRLDAATADALAAILHRLNTIDARLPPRWRGRRGAAPQSPASAPSPSPVLSEGEAGTAGPSVPGAP